MTKAIIFGFLYLLACAYEMLLFGIMLLNLFFPVNNLLPDLKIFGIIGLVFFIYIFIIAIFFPEPEL